MSDIPITGISKLDMLKIQSLLVAYCGHELDVDGQELEALEDQFHSYCYYFGIPASLIEEEWSNAGVTTLVLGSLNRLKKMIKHKTLVSEKFVKLLVEIKISAEAFLEER